MREGPASNFVADNPNWDRWTTSADGTGQWGGRPEAQLPAHGIGTTRVGTASGASAPHRAEDHASTKAAERYAEGPRARTRAIVILLSTRARAVHTPTSRNPMPALRWSGDSTVHSGPCRPFPPQYGANGRYASRLPSVARAARVLRRDAGRRGFQPPEMQARSGLRCRTPSVIQHRPEGTARAGQATGGPDAQSALASPRRLGGSVAVGPWVGPAFCWPGRVTRWSALDEDCGAG